MISYAVRNLYFCILTGQRNAVLNESASELEECLSFVKVLSLFQDTK